MAYTKKKWPTEQWDFRDIITGDYHYIDRTAEMWKLANEHQLVFLARPRRFYSILKDSLGMLVLIGMAFNGHTQQFTWKAEG